LSHILAVGECSAFAVKKGVTSKVKLEDPGAALG